MLCTLSWHATGTQATLVLNALHPFLACHWYAGDAGEEAIPNLDEQPNQGEGAVAAGDGDDDCPDISELELVEADDEVGLPVCLHLGRRRGTATGCDQAVGGAPLTICQCCRQSPCSACAPFTNGQPGPHSCARKGPLHASCLCRLAALVG